MTFCRNLFLYFSNKISMSMSMVLKNICSFYIVLADKM